MPANGALLWLGFNAFIIGMLLLDLFVLHREAHTVGLREAGIWSVIWVSLGLAFGVGVYVWWGPTPGLQYFTGFLIEKSLSVDNIFVFLMIFSYFSVPPQYQHRVLFWGIFGALVMRLAFILVGIALLELFHWLVYVLGGFLIWTGIKMAGHRSEAIDPAANPVLRVVRRYLPVLPRYEGQRFLVRKDGRLLATPLLLVLVLVETTDLVFALDSIPAILAITRDPFIAYSSNAFAILGLRALYFLLAGVLGLFRYLKVGLSAILVFIGAKMVLVDVVHVPIGLSLAVVFTVLFLSVAASLMIRPAEGEPAAGGPEAARPEVLSARLEDPIEPGREGEGGPPLS